MDEVFVFEKTFTDRINDFEQVFFQKNSVFDPSRIRKEWANYFDVVLEPSGWKALWKIPQDLCVNFDIPYPNIVLTCIHHIDYEKLTARVEILAVHGDIHLPQHVDAELMHLHPAVSQNKSIANIATTAEALEMFQFFYNNIWLPWDENDDAWTINTIERRLKLCFDVIEGKMRGPQINYLRSLLKQGQILMNLLKNFDCTSQSNSGDLWAIERRLIQLRNEFEPFINEDIRKVLFMKRRKDEETPKTILIFSPNTCDEHFDYITQCKKFISSKEQPEVVTHLYDALKVANKSTKILLGNGVHDLTNYSHGCEYVGAIIGVQDRLKTIINIAPDSIALFEIAGEEMVLKNLKITVEFVSSAIIVRKGLVTMVDCIVESTGALPTRQGIIVHPDGELVMKNCHLRGFNIGINGKGNAYVNLESCSISQCEKGIKITDQTKLKISSTIIHSTDCGLHIETETQPSQSLSGNAFKDLSSKFENLTIDSLKFENSTQNDVRIVSKSRQIPFEDLVTPSHKFGEDFFNAMHSQSDFKKSLQFGTKRNNIENTPMDSVDLGVEYLID